MLLVTNVALVSHEFQTQAFPFAALIFSPKSMKPILLMLLTGKRVE